ncbi:hypothetical protein H4219_003421 [Mycoemilia scoparia]|uniref:WLM domain-containing protein n=1 Tax=Mycoemilia scoparia TaxID=417184 RepID=A0A9W7ZVN1_9FUNG|nr:hypothetical protein H4219_003421 [Mycoemilia scoparia]
MKKRNWKVGKLLEFYPKKSTNLLGLNVNHGQTIKIRLRYPHNINAFLPFSDILGTMLHELVHINISPHNQEFYDKLNELKRETEELISLNQYYYNLFRGNLSAGGEEEGKFGPSGERGRKRGGRKLGGTLATLSTNSITAGAAGSLRNSVLTSIIKRNPQLSSSPPVSSSGPGTTTTNSGPSRRDILSAILKRNPVYNSNTNNLPKTKTKTSDPTILLDSNGKETPKKDSKKQQKQEPIFIILDDDDDVEWELAKEHSATQQQMEELATQRGIVDNIRCGGEDTDDDEIEYISTVARNDSNASSSSSSSSSIVTKRIETIDLDSDSDNDNNSKNQSTKSIRKPSIEIICIE